MILSNILLQIPEAAPVDTVAASHIENVTGKVAATVDSIVANPESLSVTNIAKTVVGIDWSSIITSMSGMMFEFILRVLAAVLVFYVGKFVINKVHKLLKAVMERKKVEPSLNSFLLSLFKMSMLFLLIITTIAILGIETGSFIALFASAGVAVGMALSGTLQNFAGGVLLLLLKPYKVGDFIEAENLMGTVKEIQIFHTVILTPNNERITIPNGGLATGTINNFSSEPYRRVEWRVGISYGDSVDKAREVIMDILDKEPLAIHGEMCPNSVALEELADSAVTLVVRSWCTHENYWTVFYNVNERIYNELPKNGLNFPFPQMDVHLDNPAK